MPALAHLGLGFASKRFAPNIPLWALLIASMLIDLPYFIFWDLQILWITHGLVMALVWSSLAMLLSIPMARYLSERNSQSDEMKPLSNYIQIGAILGLLVFSHWILDFIGWPMSVVDAEATGIPLFFDDSATYGLGVYSTWIGGLGMDIGMFLLGIAVYLFQRRDLKS